MKTVINLIIICILGLMINDYFLAYKVNEIKQEIVEIKKDYSYDPKDAK